MASKPNGGKQSDLLVSFFHKLASSVPGVLFTYWLSPDQQTHHYPYVSDQVRALFGAEPSALNDNADVVSRFGGEEFLVVFAAIESEEVKALVLRILEVVRNETFIYNGDTIAVTASAGVVGVEELTGEPVTPHLLIDHADRRLYQAKQGGRDCLVDASGLSRI